MKKLEMYLGGDSVYVNSDHVEAVEVVKNQLRESCLVKMISGIGYQVVGSAEVISKEIFMVRFHPS